MYLAIWNKQRATGSINKKYCTKVQHRCSYRLQIKCCLKISSQQTRLGTIFEKPVLWLGYRLGYLGSEFRQRTRDFPLLRIVKTGSGLTQPPIQWVPGFFPGGGEVKWPERYVNHSNQFRADVENEWSPYAFTAWTKEIWTFLLPLINFEVMSNKLNLHRIC